MEYQNKNIEFFLKDTVDLISKAKAAELGTAANAAHQASKLANDVEFWKWMHSNFPNMGTKYGLTDTFQNPEMFKQYLSNLPEQSLQSFQDKLLGGKLYEADWVANQRDSLSNIGKSYDLGAVSNQPGHDVVETSLFSGSQQKYQHKAYQNPLTADHLKTTTPDTTVITPNDNIPGSDFGGRQAEGFQTKKEMMARREQVMTDAKAGNLNMTYNAANVGKIMGKAAIVGAIIGASIEAITRWKEYKAGKLSKEEYLKEVGKAGGHLGATGGITAGLMIPVKSAFITGGISNPIILPIAFAIGVGVDKIIAPMFARGEYLKNLKDMKFYKDIGDAYGDFAVVGAQSAQHFQGFCQKINMQNKQYDNIKKQEETVNRDLIDAFNKL